MPAERLGLFSMLNKPSWWLPSADWAQWLALHAGPDGTVRCKTPGCNKPATSVDHIVPRTSDQWEGVLSRAHAPDNLQPMCRAHNSEKGVRPDEYWNRNFYFDRRVNLDRLRASQSDFVYHPLYQYREQLAGRISQVNGKLNCFLQCTGAGKTIGKAMIPFAINHGALAHFEGSGHKPPRCDRILIVPITTDLRDQIALELGGRPLHMCRNGQTPLLSQLVEFGIVDTAPRVKAIAGFDQLASAAHDYDHDIFVICSQSLWDSGSEDEMKRTTEGWAEAFRSFPVIIFDEFHRYTQKIREVIHRSAHSLCFGMSASPMTGLGLLLDDTTRITEYTYRDAALKDNSMKSMGAAVDINPPPLNPTFEDIITEMRTDRTQQLDGSTQSGVGFGNYAPMMSVGWGVVERLKQTDNRRQDRQLVAGFRNHLRSEAVKRVVADLDYGGHAVIGVRSIDEVISLQQHLNEEFEKNRERFPVAEGWHASVTHSGRPRRGKLQAIPGVPLDENHPWFRSVQLRKEGAPSPYLDKGCSRILIVKDKCKEGTNNPFCNVIGWARPYDTDIGLIQRNGRAGRSFHVLDLDGTLHVPPQELDTMHLVTHEAYGNGSAVFAERHEPLVRALQFFVDPHGWRSADGKGLKDIPSFRSWLECEVGSTDVNIDDEDELISGDDTARIVDYLARISSTGGPVREDDLLKHCRAERSQQRRRSRILRRADEIHNRDDDRLRKIRAMLGIDSILEFGELMSLSVAEKPDLKLEAPKAVAYMENMSGGEKLEEMATALATLRGPEYAETVLTAYCVTNAPVYRGKSYYEQEAPRLVGSSVLDRANEVASTLIRRFPSQFTGVQGQLIRFAVSGIRIKLGLKEGQKLEKGGAYDVPAVFVELGEKRHQRELQGYVLRKMMSPDLERVLGIGGVYVNDGGYGDDSN